MYLTNNFKCRKNGFDRLPETSGIYFHFYGGHYKKFFLDLKFVNFQDNFAATAQHSPVEKRFKMHYVTVGSKHMSASCRASCSIYVLI